MPPSASTAEIKDAFYRQSKKVRTLLSNFYAYTYLQYHPDVSEKDAQRFLDLKEAYDTLRDEERRSLYDRTFSIDPDLIIGRSYAPQRSGASHAKSRSSEMFRGGIFFADDPTRRFGHFYDPNVTLARERTNRLYMAVFVFAIALIIGTNIYYIHRSHRKQIARSAKN